MGVYQIGEVIKRTRESLGITQEELYDGICSAETLSRIENGKRPPSNANFRALMGRLGKDDEKYRMLVHSGDMETIMEAMNIDILISHDENEKAEKVFEHFKQMVDLEDNANRQYVIKTQALIDYSLGKISVQTKRERLVEAFLCTIPNYKEGMPGFVDMKLMIESIIQKVSSNAARMFLVFFMVL